MPIINETFENAVQNNGWKTLHIFGYGQTRLVTDLIFLESQVRNENILEVRNENINDINDINFKNNFVYSNIKNNLIEKNVLTSTLINAQPLIDFIYSKKPIDNNAGLLYHAITIVKDIRCMYVSKNNLENNFIIKYTEIDSLLIQNLVDELQLIIS